MIYSERIFSDVFISDSACFNRYDLTTKISENIPNILVALEKTKCRKYIFDICLVEPSNSVSSIFGFTTFVTALALLIIIYTSTDIRYRFRISITPFPLLTITYFAIFFIGFGTLLTDIWFDQSFLLPAGILSNHAFWQGLFGTFFLLIAILWIRFAYVKPPKFSKRNAKKYFERLYHAIVKGSEEELPTIANELARSAYSIVNLAINSKHDIPIYSAYANDILLLIGNRKFCRHIVHSSPITAIMLFEAVEYYKKYKLPLGQFGQGITVEALINTDSILYHEDHGFNAGLLGYIKPFSQTIYGNFHVVEGLAFYNQSPLDVNYRLVSLWTHTQLEVYTKISLIFIKDYLKKCGNYFTHSYSYAQCLDIIQRSCGQSYKLNGATELLSSDIYKKLDISIKFIRDVFELLNDNENNPSYKLGKRERYERRDIYDYIADLIFEIIFDVTSVKEPFDTCWTIQHNTVWGPLTSLGKSGKGQKIVFHKLRRLMFDEIIRLEELANFKSAKILGYCLNIMGFELKKEDYGKEWFALQKVALNWTKCNFLKLHKASPEVAKACLYGSISLDKKNNRLVKTYSRFLEKRAPKRYLKLD